MVLKRFYFLIALSIGVLIMTAGCTAPPASRGDSADRTAGGTYGSARLLYQSGDYLLAAERLIPLAEGGDARAQYALGYMYYYGKGVLADRERAVQLFRRASQQGNARAAQALKLLKEADPESPLAASTDRPPEVTSKNDSTSKVESVKKNASEGDGSGEIAAREEIAVVPQPLPETAENDTSRPTPKPQATPSAAVRPPPIVVADPEPVPAESLPDSGGSLQGRDPDNWTIQLVAASEYVSVQRFIVENGLQDRTEIMRSQRNGEPWFVVIYGVYTTLDEARQALEALPSKLRKNRPWIRKVGGTLANGG